MKIFEGIVVSNKSKNTAVVEVVRRTAHPIYGKLIRRNQRYLVETVDFSLLDGDRVKIGETKPLSGRKHFKIIEVLKNGEKKNIKEKKK